MGQCRATKVQRELTVAAVQAALPSWLIRREGATWVAEYPKKLIIEAPDGEALVHECWWLQYGSLPPQEPMGRPGGEFSVPERSPGDDAHGRTGRFPGGLGAGAREDPGAGSLSSSAESKRLEGQAGGGSKKSCPTCQPESAPNLLFCPDDGRGLLCQPTVRERVWNALYPSVRWGGLGLLVGLVTIGSLGIVLSLTLTRPRVSSSLPQQPLASWEASTAPSSAVAALQEAASAPRPALHTPPPSFPDEGVYRVTSATRLRHAPDAHAQMIMMLRVGVHLRVTRAVGEYVEVDPGQGRPVGYVWQADVEPVQDQG